MPNVSRTNWPQLAKAWDDYGHSIAFEDLIGIKVRSDGWYVVVAWKEGEKHIGVADLAYDGEEWQMQNDSEMLTIKQWKSLRIVPDCDWFEVDDEEDES